MRSGDTSSAFLGRYDRQWRARFGREMDISYLVNQRIARWTDEQWDESMDLLKRVTPDQAAELLRGDYSVGLFLSVLRRNPGLMRTGARKFFDILDAREAQGAERAIDKDDVILLSTGRHFRLSPRAKLVVARSEVENVMLEHHVAGRARLEARDFLGPVALVEGTPTWEERLVAARIVARYGKGKDAPKVAVGWREGELEEIYEVEPERDEARIEALRL